ncbi:uncharacterized protein BCR38DRAFT_343945 [Pseudomassariella vexata]|uniref:Gag1-like clamp domain-containing protein n=1 Tax=Pseudomassariella vexata TaxID=1141098 RepID=A0A1Y2DY87_9PEZI|nr:uncharacterized protein BCR38DRAFT_343945 [Pseudomassariella vexata]ORY64231.1 hypothetical protein BCR38DRAFT_343945 [Pseudomassariella vexata]
MLFSDLYKSPKSPLSRLRREPQPIPPPSPDYEVDLISKDKVKQKEAVKKHLAARIRSDWEFKWPRPTEGSPPTFSPHGLATPPEDKSGPHQQPPNLNGASRLDVDDVDSDDETASTYSTVSDDPVHFQPRAEWSSDISDDDMPASPSAYRFDTPEAVGSTVNTSALVKRAKRRRAMRAEEAWNPGLACFNARRNAWTGAKTVRIKSKSSSNPTCPSHSSRRLSFWRITIPTSPTTPSGHAASTTSPLSPSVTRTSGETTAVASSDAESKEAAPKQDSANLPVETLLPIPPPLLPPANPMRASITPATYSSIYDKIVVQSMTPACPVNLGDMLRACVVGWKRDGEWPPRQSVMANAVVAVRKKKRESNASANSRPSTGRRMSFGFLGRRESSAGDPKAGPSDNHEHHGDDGSGTGKGIRRSLQRVLGLGHERSASNASNNGGAA